MQRSMYVLLLMIGSTVVRAEVPITAAALSPDHRHIVLGSQNGIEVCSWPELTVERRLSTELIHVHDLNFAMDGQMLLAAGGSPAEAGAVEVLTWPDGQLVRRVGLDTDVVYRVAWSPDGQHWASAGADSICQTFERSTGERQAHYDGHSRAVLSLVYLPDGQSIASVGVDQTLRLWNSQSGQHLRTLDNHVGVVNAIAVRPASRSESERALEPTFEVAAEASSPTFVATISEDRTVRLWQPSIGRLVRFIKLESPPRALAWSASGDRLWVGCNDGKVRGLDGEDLSVVLVLEGLPGRIHELIVDETSRQIFIGGEGGCRAVTWDR